MSKVLPGHLIIFDQSNEEILKCNLCGKIQSTDREVIKKVGKGLILCEKCMKIGLKEAKELARQKGENGENA